MNRFVQKEMPTICEIWLLSLCDKNDPLHEYKTHNEIPLELLVILINFLTEQEIFVDIVVWVVQ